MTYQYIMMVEAHSGNYQLYHFAIRHIPIWKSHDYDEIPIIVFFHCVHIAIARSLLWQLPCNIHPAILLTVVYSLHTSTYRRHVAQHLNNIFIYPPCEWISLPGGRFWLGQWHRRCYAECERQHQILWWRGQNGQEKSQREVEHCLASGGWIGRSLKFWLS